ncbi:MAG: PIN domain-containing protein [Planctomycetes bacterium]|nr:PIN domain-containing protein [Planctomycetota bacterium]MBI3843715.1 PIN domain-containing protein [Planctomycetota bacterium]
MTLADTSIWVHHFRGSSEVKRLSELIESREVMVHPWVIGGIALGNLGRRRVEILSALRRLPLAPVVSDETIFDLIDRFALEGSGIGWVDGQLLASARTASAKLWTHDRALSVVAESVGL